MVHLRHFGHLQISYLQSQFIGMLLVNLREGKEPPAPEGPICSLVWAARGAPPRGPRSAVLCGEMAACWRSRTPPGVKTAPAQGLGFSALFSVGLTID